MFWSLPLSEELFLGLPHRCPRGMLCHRWKFKFRTSGKSSQCPRKLKTFSCNCSCSKICNAYTAPSLKRSRVCIDIHLLSRCDTKRDEIKTFTAVILIIWHELFAKWTRRFWIRDLVVYWFHSHAFYSFHIILRNLHFVTFTSALYSGRNTTMAQVYASPFKSARMALTTVVVSIEAAWKGNCIMFLATLLRSKAVATWSSSLDTLLMAMIYECKMDSFFSSSKGIVTLAFLISWYDWKRIPWASL